MSGRHYLVPARAAASPPPPAGEPATGGVSSDCYDTLIHWEAARSAVRSIEVVAPFSMPPKHALPDEWRRRAAVPRAQIIQLRVHQGRAIGPPLAAQNGGSACLLC